MRVLRFSFGGSKIGFWVVVTIVLLLVAATNTFAQQVTDTRHLTTKTKQQLAASYGFLAQYGLDYVAVEYTTLDVKGKPDTASGLLLIPTGLADQHLPLLVYHHGTVSGKEDVPSKLRGGYEVAEAAATSGYIVLAPDFLGLGRSRGFHPYVHAASEASAGIDMLIATKKYLQQTRVPFNSLLFVTGYSQGGHAAMAMHQVLEKKYAATLPVTAAAPMSGPYSISGAMLNLLGSEEEYLFPDYLINVVLGYNEVYGFYSSYSQYLKAPYDEWAKDYYEGRSTLDALRDKLIKDLKAKHGKVTPKNMVQDSVLTKVLSDVNHPFRKALAENDTYNWAPKAPTRLIYCKADEQVVYTNALIAETTMNNLGAADVKAMDVQSNANHFACVFPAVLNVAGFFQGYYNTLVSSVKPGVSLPQLAFFPNPARDRLFLKGLKANTFVSVYDLSGKVLWQSQSLVSDTVELDVQDFPAGIYIIQAAGYQTERLVITR